MIYAMCAKHKKMTAHVLGRGPEIPNFPGIHYLIKYCIECVIDEDDELYKRLAE